MTAIIDYGVGNIYSVYTSVKNSGGNPFITKRPEDLKKAKYIVLPGVGAFSDGMKNLVKTGMDGAIKGQVKKGKYFFGICLGLQLLFSWSEEGNCKGMDVIGGKVNKFLFKKKGLNIPHMGWNQVKILKPNFFLFKGVPQNSYFYFAHSYYTCPDERSKIAGLTEYGLKFPSIVECDNIIGVQFHPEKSGELGLQIFKNFLRV